jgi:hypothetical protein
MTQTKQQLSLEEAKHDWRVKWTEAYIRQAKIGALFIVPTCLALAFWISGYMSQTDAHLSWIFFGALGVVAMILAPIPIATVELGPYPTPRQYERTQELLRAYNKYKAAEEQAVRPQPPA